MDADPSSGSMSSDMRVTLLFKDLPIELEDKGGMWMGIGFGTKSMLGADIVICQWDDSVYRGKCWDHFSNTLTYPSSIADIPIDEVKNVRYVSGVKADNKLEIKFRRYLQTGDSDDYKMNEG